MPEIPRPVKLTSDSLRLPLEGFVSAHLGRGWSVKTAADLADFACHPAALLSDGSYSVFAKFSDAANGADQFEIELASLLLLNRLSGVLIPAPVGILPVGGGTLLVLEEVRQVERTPLRWRQIGAALARLHTVKSDRFGLENDVYLGPVHQDNTPLEDWPSFYAQRRLIPGLKMAFDTGCLPPPLVKKIERIIACLPQLCGPSVAPSLLHGDAQQNNFISSEQGAVVIDPAAYFGHPEMDLAWLDAFQPVPQDVFDGYREVLPIDPGFWERRSLWKLWGSLVSVAVEGEFYLEKLTAAAQGCSV